MVWHIGPLTIHLYGLTLGIAVMVGYVLAKNIGQSKGMGSQEFERVFWWGLVGALLGARLYHVIDFWEIYHDNLLQIVRLWDGGLGIFGAIIGAVVVVLIWGGKNAPKYLDLLALTLPLSQAIGRFGNYFNKELYGKPTTLPWGMHIEKGNGFFHPLFAYESLLNILFFGLLWWIYKKGVFDWGKGDYFAMYLIGYGSIRLLLEPLRINPWMMSGLLVGQMMALVMICVGSLYLIKRRLYER